MISVVKIAPVLVIATLAAGWYWTNNELTILSREYEVLNSSIESQIDEIEFLKYNADYQIKQLQEINDKFEEQDDIYNQSHIKLLSDKERIIDIAQRKPELLESIINKSMSQLMRDFHTATSHP